MNTLNKQYSSSSYKDFQKRFKLLVSKNKHLVVTTLSNIFTMRLIGNKTHGDLAEIGIVEFINQFMYDYKSQHVGKDLYRAKEHEEDILIVNELTKERFPLSLKAYGDGPLQLSTDKKWKMFPYLESFRKTEIKDIRVIKKILNSDAFSEFENINVMPLIYNEKEKKCNIMVFNQEMAKDKIRKILRKSDGKGRKHAVYLFMDADENYVCEVRYGGAAANALQRGLWTHTKKAQPYFDSLTEGWIDYSYNTTLVKLFSLALVASEDGHKRASTILQEDIDRLKKI